MCDLGSYGPSLIRLDRIHIAEVIGSIVLTKVSKGQQQLLSGSVGL